MTLRIYSLIEIHVFLIGVLKGCIVYAVTCYYLDQQSYAIHQMYCEGECCQDNGRKEEICCDVTWSAGTIVGVCLGSVAIIAVITSVGVYLFLTMKKKRKQEVDPQSNCHAQIELQLNNNRVGSSRTNVRDVSSSLSQNSRDPPPPYSSSSNPHRPTSSHSQTSQLSFINEPDRLGKPNLQPPPYSAQTMRSPARVGRLSPHVYTFQPSPARSLAPSRAW